MQKLSFIAVIRIIVFLIFGMVLIPNREGWSSLDGFTAGLTTVLWMLVELYNHKVKDGV